MTGGTRFRLWMQRAGAELLTKDQIDGLCARFLQEAAKDSGGERMYIPTGVSKRTDDVRMAMKLAQHGFSFKECREILGPDLSETTFYRWKRERYDFKALKEHEWRDMKQGVTGYVYGMRFVGAANDEEFIKVGMTGLVRERANVIELACPLKLEEIALLGVKEIRKEHRQLFHIERAVHAEVSNRVSGEWFKPDGGLDEVMDAMERVGDEWCSGYVLSRI